MRTEGGFYWIPIMPRALAEKTNGPRVDWPKDVEAEYNRLHTQFTASKAEFSSWVRKDRDGRMTANAKLILIFLVESLNFNTGRCDPAHQTIADELELGLRTVQRLMPQIAASGWIEVIRRGKTTSNFYRLRVPCEKVHSILDRVDGLRERRREEREDRRRRMSEPPVVADHPDSEPPFERSHEPPVVADHEPPVVADKPLKRTPEEEPLNYSKGSEGEGYTLRAREDVESPYEAPASLEESRRFLVRIGVPPHRLETAMQRHMREALFPCDVEEWKREARSERAA
ncbi:hypothetical protein [Arvimicrobium flavum]|uniref:hypothetical protein n=1 Tax=Arvimicrobium flavum TaxID=3393320 RepID=UPI00237A90E5|nr:hypothetical protein [Mesorhizobium shangrilense]